MRNIHEVLAHKFDRRTTFPRLVYATQFGILAIFGLVGVATAVGSLLYAHNHAIGLMFAIGVSGLVIMVGGYLWTLAIIHIDTPLSEEYHKLKHE